MRSIKDWSLTKKKISHKKNNYFSIIGIKVKTNKREVSGESTYRHGIKDRICGLIKKFKNTNHYLCRFILKPGSKAGTFSCTVNTSKFSGYKKARSYKLSEKINF